MARRRFHNTGTRTMPQAIPVLKPVLNVAGLAAAYEWSTINRMASLTLALEWYAEAIKPATNKPSPLLYGAPLTAAQQKTFDLAAKVKMLGDGSPYPEERMTSYAKTIALYEQIWSGRGLPLLADAEKTPIGQRVSGIQTVLSNFNAAFGSFGVAFRVTFSGERSLDRNEVLLPESDVAEMIGQTPLKSVLAEATTVAKVTAVEADAEGNRRMNGQLFMANLPKVLASVADWAGALGGSATKPVGKLAKSAPKASASSSAARAASTPSNKMIVFVNDPFGIFRRNTAKAGVANLLSDKQWHALGELEEECTKRGTGVSQVGWAVKELRAKGHVIESRGGREFRLVS